MPLRLSVGLSRKVGEPAYSSRGACVNLELEVDTALVAEPGKLQERIRELFGLARQSIQEELHGTSEATPTSSPANNGNASSTGDQHRHAPPRSTSNGNGHSRGQQRGSTSPPATASQIRALHAITGRQNRNLDGIVRDQYGVDDPAALTIAQASELIDDLNSNKAAAAVNSNNAAAVGGRR